MVTYIVKCVQCEKESNDTYTIALEGQVDHHIEARPITIIFQGRSVPLAVGAQMKVMLESITPG